MQFFAKYISKVKLKYSEQKRNFRAFLVSENAKQMINFNFHEFSVYIVAL